jgi:hypothetical protein
LQVSRARNDSSKAVLCEKPLKEQELRVEILLLGRLIDDSNA